MANGTNTTKPQGSFPHVSHSSSHFGKKLIWTLVGILLAYCVVLVGTMIRNNMQRFYTIGYADRQERTITVDGEGKVTAVPDIAMTSIGMTAQGKSVEEAQEKNTEVMNKLIGSLKGLGIDDKDIQTSNYNVYPKYDYTQNEGQVLNGYEVSQNVSIKIRKVSKAKEVLALVGTSGANQVSGLTFTVDEPEHYQAEARQKALKNAYGKAAELSRMLGVRVIGVVAYSESNAGYPVPMAYDKMEALSTRAGAAPDIEPGSNEMTVRVSVTFEIR